MELDNDKLKNRIEELKSEKGEKFKCNSKSIESDVFGLKITNVGNARSNEGLDIILMEPECGYYRGRYYQGMTGMNKQGGGCSVGGYCTKCDYEKIDLLKSL
jgi:hypothetical protein